MLMPGIMANQISLLIKLIASFSLYNSSSGGVRLESRHLKIDTQGYEDTRTGERYQRVVADDIQVSDVMLQVFFKSSGIFFDNHKCTVWRSAWSGQRR